MNNKATDQTACMNVQCRLEYMHGSRKFCQRGTNRDKVFRVLFFKKNFSWGEGGSKYHYKGAIISMPAKRHLYGVLLACRWWPNIEFWLGSLVIFQGIRTSIAKKHYILLFFRGDGTPVPPSGSAEGIHKRSHYLHLPKSNFLLTRPMHAACIHVW